MLILYFSQGTIGAVDILFDLAGDYHIVERITLEPDSLAFVYR